MRDRDVSNGNHAVDVYDGIRWHRLTAQQGANLRRVLLRHDLSPYTQWTRRLNCGGRGLCATCGVRIDDPTPLPTHWHDRLAARFGYPRLSCQIAITRPLVVRLLPEKIIWGRRA